MGGREIRVLQLIDGFTVGGAERVVLMLATNTNRERFKIIPCAVHRAGPIEDELKAAGVEYRVLGLQRRSILTGPLFLADLRRILVALTATMQELAIDIVHAHLTQSTLLGILATRRVGSPRLCATVHNVILHNQRGCWSPRQWLMRAGIRAVFSRADRIIAVSEQVADATLLHIRLPRERVITIPNGIDSERFRMQGNRDELRQQLDVPIDKPVVVSIGRLTQQKGYPYLLAALALISPEERPLTLIAGDGPDRHELEVQAQALGLSHTHFLGNRQDIPALLAAADIFVLPSLWEGLPLVLLEAMSSGLPAVVTAVGGNQEVVEHGKSGLLVPAADVQALAAAIRRLLSNPWQREQMGQAARERFERRFSLQRFVHAHESLYEEILMAHAKHSATVNSSA
jgi:glycosyltransferase involved in cell wall biosynthesis